MKWVIKAFLQKLFSMLPNGESLNYFCQKHITRSLPINESQFLSMVVRPVKAGVFSRRQSCQGKSQRPCSLDSKVMGNQDLEAYRQHHLRMVTSH